MSHGSCESPPTGHDEAITNAPELSPPEDEKKKQAIAAACARFEREYKQTPVAVLEAAKQSDRFASHYGLMIGDAVAALRGGRRGSGTSRW